MSTYINNIGMDRRLELLQRANFCCEDCGWKGTPNVDGRLSGLQVHHKDGWHHRPEDHRDENVVVVCAPCHDKRHGNSGRASRTQHVGGRGRKKLSPRVPTPESKGE
jgi:5-methylcytosine-specific restriction endonuclease McrA